MRIRAMVISVVMDGNSFAPLDQTDCVRCSRNDRRKPRGLILVFPPAPSFACPTPIGLVAFKRNKQKKKTPQSVGYAPSLRLPTKRHQTSPKQRHVPVFLSRPEPAAFHRVHAQALVCALPCCCDFFSLVLWLMPSHSADEFSASSLVGVWRSP